MPPGMNLKTSHWRSRRPALTLALLLAASSISVAACSPSSAADLDAASAPTRIAATHPRSWDYVAIGGDFTYAHGWDQLYAQYLETDLGIPIRLQDLSTHDFITLDRWLERIQSSPELRRSIEDAEVLTYDVQVEAYLARPTSLYEAGFCGGDDGQDCLRQALARLEADIDPFLDELTQLASPSDTIVRTFDLGNMMVYAPLDIGLAAEYLPELSGEETRMWATYQLEAYQIVHKAADARGITSVNLPRIFQPEGPFTVPPDAESFLMLGFSAKGETIIAQMLREAGYDYDRP